MELRLALVLLVMSLFAQLVILGAAAAAAVFVISLVFSCLSSRSLGVVIVVVFGGAL